MLRALFGSCSRICATIPQFAGLSAPLTRAAILKPSFTDVAARNPFSTFMSGSYLRPLALQSLFAQNRPLLVTKNYEINPSRTLIKYSLQKGKRKTVKCVLRRFYRLDWGIWIRTKCGRHKHIYKKSWRRRRRLRQHVFTNATQSWLLDTMVTRYWRRPKYIPDDPYAPYHKREEFPTTRKSPQVPEVAS